MMRASGPPNIGGSPPESLDGLGQALWWQNELVRAMELRERAYSEFARRGEPARAGAIAVFVAREYFFLHGNFAASNGWLARAQTLFEEAGPCPERAWLEITRGRLSADHSVMEQHAREAIALAQRFGDRDLEILGMSLVGLALVHGTRIPEGMTLLDEAMAAATGGEVKSLWGKLLQDELGRSYLTELLACVHTNGAGIFPPKADVFRALELTPPGDTKAVIVGQDPYHGPGQAHGLCFSVRPGFKPLPPSLLTIMRELESDGYRASDDGNLRPWARQGVLLLNTALTVRAGKPGSHSARWRRFTDAVIRIAARDPDAVFLLWGAHAQRKKPIITAIRGSEANILESSHPAPPACYRPCGGGPAFVESHPFRNTNQLLKSSGGEIDWNLV